jgi:hypothetical protein
MLDYALAQGHQTGILKRFDVAHWMNSFSESIRDRPVCGHRRNRPPQEISRTRLRSDFPYDNQNGLLEAIGLEHSVQRKTEEYQRRDRARQREFGFGGLDVVTELASAIKDAGIDPTDAITLIRQHAPKPALPEEEVRNQSGGGAVCWNIGETRPNVRQSNASVPLGNVCGLADLVRSAGMWSTRRGRIFTRVKVAMCGMMTVRFGSCPRESPTWVRGNANERNVLAGRPMRSDIGRGDGPGYLL